MSSLPNETGADFVDFEASEYVASVRVHTDYGVPVDHLTVRELNVRQLRLFTDVSRQKVCVRRRKRKVVGLCPEGYEQEIFLKWFLNLVVACLLDLNLLLLQ